jgi:hypothetical protein
MILGLSQYCLSRRSVMALETGAIEGRRFVTMRFARIKTWGHAYSVGRHNMREMECRHLEPGAPGPSILRGGPDISGRIREVLAIYGIKHKPGEVLALEFVVSTSREVFEGLDRDERQSRICDLIGCTMRAFRDRFTIDHQIVSVVLHKDERTPHLHIVVVPLVEEADNRRRDRTPFVRLSAKRVVGGRGDMVREQTRFASFFAEMGLERGQHQSRARHVSNREHEARLDDEIMMLGIETARFEREREAVEMEREGLAADTARLEMEREALEGERLKVQREANELAVIRQQLMSATADVKTRRAMLEEALGAAERLGRRVAAIPAEVRSDLVKELDGGWRAVVKAAKKASANDDWLIEQMRVRAGRGRS